MLIFYPCARRDGVDVRIDDTLYAAKGFDNTLDGIFIQPSAKCGIQRLFFASSLFKNTWYIGFKYICRIRNIITGALLVFNGVCKVM